MKIFLSKRVSALPLLDSDGRVVDIYAKFDAIQLAADKSYTNLDATVYEALQHRSDWFEGVRKCSENDSLFTVIEAIVKAEVHRLIVTDQQQRVVGVISLSDILNYLVLMPPSPDPTESQTAVPLIIATETTHSASVPFIHAAVAPHAFSSFSSFSASDTNTKKQPARE
jgi:5'-AMP-activated protein kinase regulatory gamma subunit